MIVDMTRVTNFIGQSLLVEYLRSVDIDFIGIGISINNYLEDIKSQQSVLDDFSELIDGS